MCEFKLEELEVFNFRKFENERYKLNPQMNVFAGKNGSGKTTVLEAACVMLGAYLAAFKTYVPSRFVRNIYPGDIHKKVLSAEKRNVLTAGGVPQYPCYVKCKATWNHMGESIEFQRIVIKEDGRTKFGGTNPMQSQVVSWENTIAKADHSDEAILLPLVLYLSSARLWSENNAKIGEKGIYNRTEGYNRCLNNKRGTELAFEYLKRLRDVASEEQNGKNFPAYNAILNAINTAFQEELAPGEQVIFSTRYVSDIVALKSADGTILPFSTLSDGYRNVIKIILEIATRMCILNPYLQGEALQKTPGVVVIDELDLSLHPTWQKKIIGILKTLFPKIQFICATHSPFIIQSLEDGELITLDRKLDSEYAGEGIEDIAEDVMGVKMPQYSEKKRKMYDAAAEFYDAVKEGKTQKDIEELGKKLTVLEANYSDNPAYLALMRQKFELRKCEVEHNETSE